MGSEHVVTHASVKIVILIFYFVSRNIGKFKT